MSDRHFVDMLRVQWTGRNSRLLCAGFDPRMDQIPAGVLGHNNTARLFNFCAPVVDALARQVCAFKPNFWFWARHLEALKALIDYMHTMAPDVPVILDFKCGDIGDTCEEAAALAFDELAADAVTVSPHVGQKGLAPFLRRPDKGVFVLCRTSNPGSDELQKQLVRVQFGLDDERYIPFWESVARRVAATWNNLGNCGLVIGANHPDELKVARELIGDMPILMPGIGSQAAAIEPAIMNGQTSHGTGLVVNVSRKMLGASTGPDYVEAALHAAMDYNHQFDPFRHEQ